MAESIETSGGERMSDIWYYAEGSARSGPVNTQDLKAALAKAPSPQDVYVWREDFADWKRAGDVPELYAPSSLSVAGEAAPSGGLMHLWFNPRGRLNRAKFWLVGLINLAILVVLVVIGFVSQSPPVWTVCGLLGLVFIVSGYMVGAKRLHDRAKSAWWLLLFYVAPLVLSGVGQALGTVQAQAACGLVGLAINIWAFVELGCLRGTRGSNQYGPDPLDPGFARP